MAGTVFRSRHLVFLWFLLAFAAPCSAQFNQTIPIATVRPDVAAPGMNVVLEILARDSLRPFGTDGLASLSQIVLVHPEDSDRVVFGPIEVSWNGRLLQVPAYILPNAALGTVPFLVHSIKVGQFSDTIDFSIDTPQHLGRLSGPITIGGGLGQLSQENTLLVDSLIATNATIHFSEQNPDTLPSNPRLLPVVILSKGPVRLTNSTLSVDASGVKGGPGGGGGGHGFQGSGGIGFTGGGSCPADSLSNSGSDSSATLAAGGRAATGVIGGQSAVFADDLGGGGGTGAPFGLSGAAGVSAQTTTRAGGYGGGSGAGEQLQPFTLEFGGGGGGFGTAGTGGLALNGPGPNGGNPNGGRFLVPLAGGSGGAAGKANAVADNSTIGGSGGGGGGALEITAFDSIICKGSVLSARGDSGTTGYKIAAGGGGGSGGSIYLEATDGVQTQQTSVRVEGGDSGQGAMSGLAGGSGGLGRVRIDGPSNLVPTPTLVPVWSEGISLSPIVQAPALGFVKISGVAPDTINTTDSIQIYYWTRHSAVQVVDTIRASDGSWSKWLPLAHDSLLFVAAMVQVYNPASSGSTYDYEPPWLMSNVSIGLIRHPASAFLVSVDTLNFGTVRVGRCKTLLLRIANEGEDPLILKGGTIPNSTHFSILPDTTVTIPAYHADTLEVEYCPTDTGAADATLSFVSNDSTNLPKLITLIGNGSAIHDSLVISPARLDFSRVRIDNCATDTVLLKSVGHDTLFLTQSTWSHPPFSLRLVPPDTALDSGAMAKLLVTFCPADTGTFYYAPVLDGRGDTLSIVGHGILRRARSMIFDSVGTICMGHSTVVFDTVQNLGNDTISIISIEGHHIPKRLLGNILRPDSFVIIPIMVPADTLGKFADTVSILLPDSVLSTIIVYQVSGASLFLNHSSVSFDYACIGDSLFRSLTITSTGQDTLELSNFSIQLPFRLLDSIRSLPPGAVDSLLFEFRPQPADTVMQTDTFFFTATVNGCDSAIAIPVSGSGLDSGLAAEPLSFDSVLVGKCKNDSIVIGNPCGPTAILDTAILANKDFTIISTFPDTVYSPQGARLTIQFCPSHAGMDMDTATLVFRSGVRIADVLSGVGIIRANPWAHFTVSSTTVPLDTQAIISIRLDSSSLTGKHPIKAIVTFDPTVLSLVSSFGPIATPVRADSVTFSDPALDFSKSSMGESIESLTWNTLAGPRSVSPVDLSVSVLDTFVNVQVQNGSVTLTECHGLEGQLASGGSYTLGTITPDPASEAASVTMQLGGDGYVEATIYDMTGHLVENILQETLQQGSYQLRIPTTSLASGRYMLQINSMGWHASAPFVVQR